MRVPNFDRLDDPKSPRPPARESLEVPRPDQIIIVDLNEWPDDSSALGAFAVEPRIQPLERPDVPERAEHFERPERLERPERPERLERPERPERLQRLAGLSALAAVAIFTVVALNWVQRVVTRTPEGPGQARVEHQPAPPVAGVTRADSRTPTAADRLAVLSEPVATPATQPTVAPRNDRTVNEPSRAPARVVIETPSRAPLVEKVTPRVVESTAPPPEQVPTTGVATTEVRGVPSVSTPIVSTLGTTAAAPTPPAAASPAPAPTPIAAAAANPPAAAAASAARVVVPREAVESLLGRYASAFSSLDARSAKAVWPSVNQRNLERAFESLEQQNFDLGKCDITVLPPRALALCNGTARYTPRVGNRQARTEARRWTFRLIQNGQDWSIESVEAR